MYAAVPMAVPGAVTREASARAFRGIVDIWSPNISPTRYRRADVQRELRAGRETWSFDARTDDDAVRPLILRRDPPEGEQDPQTRICPEVGGFHGGEIHPHRTGDLGRFQPGGLRGDRSSSMILLAGATPYYVNARHENDFAIDYSEVPDRIWPRVQRGARCARAWDRARDARSSCTAAT